MSRSAQRHLRQLAAGLAASTYDSAILSAGPVAFWTLAGGSAGLSDRAGKGHTATSFNGYSLTTFLDGSVATAFDGLTQYLEVSDQNDLSVPNTGILTIEAWMRPDTLEFSSQEGSGYVHWMGKGEPNQYEYTSRIYSFTNTEARPNRISGYAFNLSGGLGTGSYFQDTVTAGVWIHYVLIINTVNTNATYTTGYTKLYKNGILRDQDALTSFSTVPGNGTAPFRMATRDLASYFQGALAKIAIYDYELTPTTIRNHYETIMPPTNGSSSWLAHVGTTTATTAGTTVAIQLTFDIPAGCTLIARVAHSYTVGGPTILDSRGNTWTRDRTAANAGTTMRAALFSAQINAAMYAGDTILLTTSASTSTRVMTIDAFSNLVFGGSGANVDQINSTSGNSTTPGTTIPITTTQADDLLLGFVAVNGPTSEGYTEDQLFAWNTLTRIGTSGAGFELTVDSAYDIVGATSTYRYRPTLGTSENWIEMIASYKAGTPVITPPTLGTAIFIQCLGSAATKTTGTTLTITVPTDGVPVGHTLIVRLVTDFTSGGPTVADTRGNTYTRDRSATNAGSSMRASIFSCRVTTALQAGDTITITTTSLAARVAIIDEFANVLLPIAIDAQNGLSGTSATPSLPVTTTNANDLIIGMIGVEGPLSDAYTEDTLHQWTTLNRVGTTGGTSTTNKTINAVYRAAGATGTYTYSPTLGTSAVWIEFLMAYQAS
jgi:hypothetical protein